MALDNDVETALRQAGTALKADLWQPDDDAFLKARAKDLIGLNAKAAATDLPAKKQAYLAAAKDVVHHVCMVAVIRMEVAARHVLDALARFFIETLLPALVKALPALGALVSAFA